MDWQAAMARVPLKLRIGAIKAAAKLQDPNYVLSREDAEILARFYEAAAKLL